MNRSLNGSEATGADHVHTHDRAGSWVGRPWRLIVDGAGDAAWNMAVDEAMLQCVLANSSCPTVRLYQWNIPAVSVGRFQNLRRTIDVDACRHFNVPIVRRITGGRGILHGGDLTVSVAATLNDLGISNCKASVVEIYRMTASWFITVFDALGVRAQVGECAVVRGQDRIGNCFQIVSRADIVDLSTGRKVLGAALHRRSNAVLQQVSIPADFDVECSHSKLAGIFRYGTPLTGDEADNSYDRPLPRGDRLIECLLKVLQSTLPGAEPGGVLTSLEQEDAVKLLQSRYECASWNEEGARAPALVCN